MNNPIENALNFAYTRQLAMDDHSPDWTPDFVMDQAKWFCDELRAVSNILSNALEAGDVKMLARASAQLQYTASRQFGIMSSLITFTAAQAITEGPDPAHDKGKYENLFEALIGLDMVSGDIDGGRSAARMTDMMQEWVKDSQDNFLYLMTSALRDAGWDEDDLSQYNNNAETPEFHAGLMEDLDEELLTLFNNSDEDDEEK